MESVTHESRHVSKELSRTYELSGTLLDTMWYNQPWQSSCTKVSSGTLIDTMRYNPPWQSSCTKRLSGTLLDTIQYNLPWQSSCTQGLSGTLLTPNMWHKSHHVTMELTRTPPNRQVAFLAICNATYPTSTLPTCHGKEWVGLDKCSFTLGSQTLVWFPLK